MSANALGIELNLLRQLLDLPSDTEIRDLKVDQWNGTAWLLIEGAAVPDEKPHQRGVTAKYETSGCGHQKFVRFEE